MSKKVNVKHFFRKNFYYILLGLCLVSVATIITLAVVLDKPANVPPIDDPTGGIIEPPDDPDVPIVTEPLPFLLPIGVSYTFGYEFTGDEGYIFSSTTGRYEGHFGLDFLVEAGTSVLAAHDGTVTQVEEDILDGLIISIRHDENITTTYRALDSENILVEVGDTVERGDVIGTVAAKTLYELKLGPHLHLEVYENNIEIDPMDFFPELNK